MGRQVPSPRDCGLPEKFSAWRPAQEHALAALLASTKRIKAISAPTGFGKCFGKGTPVLLHDGRIVPVEDVTVGSAVMGADGTAKIVSGLTRGWGRLYRVSPTKGDPYIVNGDHILCLVLTDTSEYVELTVSDYLTRSATFKHRAKGYRVGVEKFGVAPRSLPLPPYFLGVWLGDGHLRSPQVTTADLEIATYLSSVADQFGLRMKRKQGHGCYTYGLVGSKSTPNPITMSLRGLGLKDRKFIPHSYRVGTPESRLQLLAGLLDTDGYLVKDTVFEISSQYADLAADIVFVARSLGFAAYATPAQKSCQTGMVGTYYRVTISGDTNTIPTRIPRRIAHPRQQRKDVLRNGIRVTPTADGDFFGFQLDSPDARFLLGDFTVVHNSAVAVAYALLTKQPTCIVTDNKGLQDQYSTDFAPCGMVDIRGRRNYCCDYRAGYTCEEGYVAQCPYRGTVACPSSVAEMRAATSSLVVTNYDKWTSARKFGQGMQHFTQVIFDEGHRATEAVDRAVQVVLHHREIEEGMRVPFPHASEAHDFTVWKPWASAVKMLAQEQFKALRAKVLATSTPKAAWIRQLTHLRLLGKRLGMIATARPADWLVEPTKDGYQFDPIASGRYAESTLFLGIPSIVIISATLRPKTLYMLGQREGSFDYQEFDSEFDPDRSPVYYIPTMRVDKRATSLDPVWLKLDQIAAQRRDRKGIVHTISYARREDLMASSRFAPSMIVNPKGEAPTDTVSLFKSSGPGTILVSPSVGAGYDFPGSSCEWQMVCKIPFPDSRSKIVKARQERDPEYAAYHAMQTLVQCFGRGMRSADDQCEGFIVDSHLDWFFPRFKHLAPRSFHRVFRRREVLPDPPPRL